MAYAHNRKVSSAGRRATNISLDPELVSEAKRLGINVSRACERGLVDRIAEERARQWRAQNAEAIASSNNYAERNGLPLAGLRQF